MAKLQENQIGAADMLEYLRHGYSDFSFELQTLRLVFERGLDCEHGGLYEDPITKKMREFDIRASARAGVYSVRLAIECKNIRENFPLLVSCVPRHGSESFHDVALVSDKHCVRDTHTDSLHKINEQLLAAQRALQLPALTSRAKVLRITGGNSCYKPNAPVVKSLAQIGRSRDKTGEIVATDSDVFEKWGQCLSSADDLVSRSYWEELDERSSQKLTAVIPILVVPDARLWRVDYGLDGERQTEPVQTNHCSMFVGMSYEMGAPVGPTYRISHLDIMTTTGLSDFIHDCLQSKTAMQTIFPNEGVWAAMNADVEE